MEFMDEETLILGAGPPIAEDDDSSHYSFSPSSHETIGSSRESEEERKSTQLFKKETQVIFKLRLLVLTLLMTVAMIVSISIFVVTFSDNASKFEHEYHERAKKVIESFTKDTVRHVESVIIATHGGDWPFETVANFQHHMTRARRNTGILSVSIAPLVTEHEFDSWDSFVADPENSAWM